LHISKQLLIGTSCTRPLALETAINIDSSYYWINYRWWLVDDADLFVRKKNIAD
jgi:hypothetical protein